MFIFVLISYVMGTPCSTPNDLNKYPYDKILGGNNWNYQQSWSAIAPSCAPLVEAPQTIPASQMSLGQLRISLEYQVEEGILQNKLNVPFNQFITNGMKLFVQSETSLNSIYVSKSFEFRLPQFRLDYLSNPLDGDLQILFELDDMYNNCDAGDLHYAVLVFPLKSLKSYSHGIGTENYNAQGRMDNVSLELDNFNFRQQVSKAFNSESVSYVHFQAQYSAPPCPITHYFVLTQPLMIQERLLNFLLAKNEANVLKVPTHEIKDYDKGSFVYFEDDYVQDLDDTVEWAATWVASVIPCLFFAIITCIYGTWRLSNVGRYYRVEENHNQEQDEQKLVQAPIEAHETPEEKFHQ